MDNSLALDQVGPRLTGLPPLVDQRSRVLVLGSFPSVRSLAGQCYYGHPRNHFWPIMGMASGEAVPPSWPARHEWALGHGLAIWDLIATCRREGSLDQAIQDAEINDIIGLLKTWPGISRVLTNGGQASRLFSRFVLPGLDPEWGEMGRVIGLPSSSPIPTRQYRTAIDKLEIWRTALGWPRPMGVV